MRLVSGFPDARRHVRASVVSLGKLGHVGLNQGGAWLLGATTAIKRQQSHMASWGLL